MTIRRTNLAGITNNELQAKLKEGQPFFVLTAFPNITRAMINKLKSTHGITCTTTQGDGGLWITPKK